MQNIKLHEATKQFKVSNKLAMFFLEKMDIPVKSHSSVISMEQLELLREFSANKEKSEIYIEFNRIEKEKKKKARLAKVAKKEGIDTKDSADTKDITTEKDEEKLDKSITVEKKPEMVQETVKTEIKENAVKMTTVGENKPVRPAKPTEKHEIQSAHESKPAPSDRKPSIKKEHSHPPRPGKPERIETAKKEHTPVELKKKKEPVQKHAANKTDPTGRPPQKQKERSNTVQKDQDSRTKKEQSVRGPGKDTKKPQKDFHRRSNDENKGGGQKRETPGRKDFHQDRRGKKYDPSKGRRRQAGDEMPKRTPPPPPKPKPKVFNLPDMIQISDYISLKELAEKLNLKLRDIEEKMMTLNKEYLTNQILDVEEIKEICSAFKVEVDMISFEDAIFFDQIERNKAQLTSRAPVVAVMGHVDHGKTTLLDTLRHTRVAAREAGGITQKIGAYKLTANGHDIVFLDTPGHEAFTNIRARGAKITDIVILVVAANDGVKPQTIEAINHAQAAEVPLVVAINKIDLPGADPNRVKQELTKHNILVEDWGGDVVSVEISAKENQNLDSLLEMVTLVSEMLELKAYKKIPGRGTIIESRLDPKLGPVGTVLIQHGQIKRSEFFICGESVGKIKSIFDENGKVLQKAEVPVPVEIMGFENVPEAGERFQITDDLEKARKVIDMRIQREKQAKNEEVNADKKLSLQNLFEKLGESKTKEFPLVIKTDNYSSCEVLETILLKKNHEHLDVNIIHKGVGNITESDVLLASTSNSMIIGFNVKAPQKILSLAKREQIEIKLYNVIYHLIEDIEKAIKGEMEPEYIETYIGQAEVLQIFKISKIGIIAGCLVKEGKVTNKSKVKILRKSDFVFEGDLETLRRIKNDVSEVNAGTECGIRVKNFNDIETGDILEFYEVKIKE